MYFPSNLRNVIQIFEAISPSQRSHVIFVYMERKFTRLTRVKDVFVLQMDDGKDNRITLELAQEVHSALDEVEKR